MKALEAATVPPSNAPAAPESVTAVTPLLGETLGQRRADALVAVAESFLATGYREGLACDASLVVLTEDSAGNVPHVGRRTRTIRRPSRGRSGAVTAAAASRMDDPIVLGVLQTLARRWRLAA